MRPEKENNTHVRLRFTVQDTGIGISKPDQARLFKSFQQVDGSRSRRFGGAGLGLVIAWRLTELMGGDSDEGRGATFWFVIEFKKGKHIDAAELMAPQSLHKNRILIVDDKKTNLEILEGYLKLWGCHCDKALNADDALTLMHAVAKTGAPYELVITDMLMPKVDGAELGQLIKADSTLNHTRMILLTSQGFRGDSADMKKIGFSGYLTKPVRPSELFDCIQTVFSHQPTDVQAKRPQKMITNFVLSEAKRQNFRILLTEDNPINRKLALHLLERFGFKTNAVQNGQEAVKALERTQYNLVLMDIQMPEMDGFEATRIIRDPDSAVLNHNIPIVAMTAHVDKKDRHACLNAGMDDYISKPIEPDELLRVIKRWKK